MITRVEGVELVGQIMPGSPLLVVAVRHEAEHLSTDLPILITGVGKLAAARSVLGTLAPLDGPDRPSLLVNLGSAGALRDGIEGIHRVGTLLQHDLDGLAIAATVGFDPSPLIVLGQGLTLATGDRFIADPTERKRLAAVADLVDMEGYAIASAAGLLGLDIIVMKHVSDQADDQAPDRWIETIAVSSMELARWLDDFEEEH